MIKKTLSLLILFGFIIMGGGHAFAGETYSGDFMKRSTLTGDWGGLRNDLAIKGITFDINVTQIEQGLADGGMSSHGQYSGRGDLILMMDTGKMGLWPGGHLTMELEGNWGHNVNLATGALSTVNTNCTFPFATRNDFAIPALNLTQVLSDYGGVVVGKINTLAGDMNEFAHGVYGKGDTQFMNLSLNANPTLLQSVPYTPLGAGVIILPTKDPHAAVINFLVLSSVGTATTSGFNTLYENKMSFIGEGRVRTGFFGLTGHQLAGFAFSNRKFNSISQRLDQVLTQPLKTVKNTWAFYYNFDQYLYETEKGSGRGFGVFGRFGVADGDPNIIKHFYSAGLAVKGLAASRPNDQFGLGWYYMGISNPKLSYTRQDQTGSVTPYAGSSGLSGSGRTLKLLRDENGLELYYNFAVTPWAILTPDIQFIRPTQKKTPDGSSVESSTVLGIRLHLLL